MDMHQFKMSNMMKLNLVSLHHLIVTAVADFQNGLDAFATDTKMLIT